MQPIEMLLRHAAGSLDALGVRWALVGGFAVGLRGRPRFTEDVDFAVAVGDDSTAEALVNRLRIRGYAVSIFMDQEYTGRLSTVRLIRPGDGTAEMFTDLLFASSGIEDEIARRAERMEVVPGLEMPVATRADLIALKVLAGRDKDLSDLKYLLKAASESEISDARGALAMIKSRGYSRDVDLMAELNAAISHVRS
jgi:predicted nucleotidyltransferase